MEYGKLALNVATRSAAGGGRASGSATDQDIAMCGGQELLEGRAKEKARRYWTPGEEERLYEIWGRDNWRLTRTGKNTIFFGKWAEELHERYGVDVKPEEIQMKVNQTRAKFRQVKKQLQQDPSSYATRWKKYDIINRILKNLHRPKNAEPLPPEALLNNRDMTPPREDAASEQIQQHQMVQQTQQGQAHAESPGVSCYNNNSNSNNGSSHNNNSSGMNFSTELFTDQYDMGVKNEYDDDDYVSLPFQEQQYSPAEPAQLLELQTPQQQQQQQQHHQQQQRQQQQQQQHQQQQQQLQQHQQQQQPQFQPGYEPQFQQQATHYVNNSSQNAVTSSTITPQPITAVAYINSSNNTISVATNANGTVSVPPATSPATNANPTTAVVAPVPVPRKRGRPCGSVNLPTADSLEVVYMEEVRRKNQLLLEQTKISRQRLQLEERKVELMQAFFPKCLEQQTQILNRIMQMKQP
ncbi:hypothetical protein KR026_003415 [Drosophila bipectinata]|nr:hypothetical protein KR026_003415 [Drosophila bipectinata]